MGRVSYGMITAEEREQVAADRDEDAWRRDRAGAARDMEAEERDRRAQARMQAALQYTSLIRRLLDAASPPPGHKPSADRHIIALGLLRHLDQALRDAGQDRQAANSDRRAAATDRRQAAVDRSLEAAHRDQTAIERAQQATGLAPGDHERGSELYAWADSARTRADAACQQAREVMLAAGSRQGLLRHAEVARLHARLETMPVIEQAKGILMAQSRCSPDEAFDVLRRASQRSNVPVRELAAQIVTKTIQASHPTSKAG